MLTRCNFLSDIWKGLFCLCSLELHNFFTILFLTNVFNERFNKNFSTMKMRVRIARGRRVYNLCYGPVKFL